MRYSETLLHTFTLLDRREDHGKKLARIYGLYKNWERVGRLSGRLAIVRCGLEADINAPEYPSSNEKARPFSRPSFQNVKPKVAYATVALEISFLIFNAAGDSSTSLDFAKNASRPPR